MDLSTNYLLILAGIELPLCVVVTILECCVTFSGVKLSIRPFVLFIIIIYISRHGTYPMKIIIETLRLTFPISIY